MTAAVDGPIRENRHITISEIAVEMKINAGQEELKSDINGVKTDISAVTAGQEELKTDISAVTAGQEELKNDMKSEISAVKNDIENGIGAVKGNITALESQLAALVALKRRAGGGIAGANADKIKQPKFDGSTSWFVFHRQFEAAAIHNHWTPREKAAHILSVLQGHAADILRSVPAAATYEDIVGALQDRFRDHQLAAAYRSQVMARVHTSGETLQEFAAAVEQLAHRALVGLPVGYIETEAAHAFIDRIRDREVKQHLLMGGDRTLNEALNQALKFEAAKAAAWPTTRLRKVTRVPTARTPTPSEGNRNE